MAGIVRKWSSHSTWGVTDAGASTSVNTPTAVQATGGGAVIDLDPKRIAIDAFTPEFDLLDLDIEREQGGRVQIQLPARLNHDGSVLV